MVNTHGGKFRYVGFDCLLRERGVREHGSDAMVNALSTKSWIGHFFWMLVEWCHCWTLEPQWTSSVKKGGDSGNLKFTVFDVLFYSKTSKLEEKEVC